ITHRNAGSADVLVRIFAPFTAHPPLRSGFRLLSRYSGPHCGFAAAHGGKALPFRALFPVHCVEAVPQPRRRSREFLTATGTVSQRLTVMFAAEPRFGTWPQASSVSGNIPCPQA